jgi:hypothetical protein
MIFFCGEFPATCVFNLFKIIADSFALLYFPKTKKNGRATTVPTFPPYARIPGPLVGFPSGTMGIPHAPGPTPHLAQAAVGRMCVRGGGGDVLTGPTGSVVFLYLCFFLSLSTPHTLPRLP